MSIIIAGVLADHVLIATDTYCVSLHGPYRFVSKAWPITHLPAVVTGRGTSGLITDGEASGCGGPGLTKSLSTSVTVAGEVVAGARVPLSLKGDRLLDLIAAAPITSRRNRARSVRLRECFASGHRHTLSEPL
jgi:hypothetical protein